MYIIPSFLAVLPGQAKQPVRDTLVHHSINGSFAIRQGQWKLELRGGSGGWSAPRPGTPTEKKLPVTQLYDLSRAIGETNNVAAADPEIVERLSELLAQQVAQGRSTPGPPRTNTGPVIIRKKQPAAER